MARRGRGLSIRDTAMPGQGRGKTDRLPSYANPGRKAGGATESGYRGSTSSRSSSWDGKNDLAFPSSKANQRSSAGSENRSKSMSQTSGTPTSVLNTGKSNFGPLSRGESSKINTGR